MNLAILGPQACSGCEFDDTYQIWCTYDEPFQSYSILVDFRFSSAAILNFEKSRFWHFGCLGGVKTKLPAKFGENRTNGSGVIQVLFYFKMAAVGHLGL